MKPHPYLRAYMAGIVVPTIFLLVVMTWNFAFIRLGVSGPDPLVFLPRSALLERLLVFPMAFVPSLWGVWNMAHLALRGRLKLPLGVHGALLPILLVPAGFSLARALDVFTIPMEYALVVIPIGMALYYLVWRHAVGFLNREMGIA